MTAPNIYTSLNVNAQIAGDSFNSPHSVVISSITATGATITAQATASIDCRLLYGTSLTHMANTDDEAASVGGEVVFTLTGLSAGTTYYLWVREYDSEDVGRTGIYTFTTPAT